MQQSSLDSEWGVAKDFGWNCKLEKISLQVFAEGGYSFRKFSTDGEFVPDFAPRYRESDKNVCIPVSMCISLALRPEWLIVCVFVCRHPRTTCHHLPVWSSHLWQDSLQARGTRSFNSHFFLLVIVCKTFRLQFSSNPTSLFSRKSTWDCSALHHLSSKTNWILCSYTRDLSMTDTCRCCQPATRNVNLYTAVCSSLQMCLFPCSQTVFSGCTKSLKVEIATKVGILGH